LFAVDQPTPVVTRGTQSIVDEDAAAGAPPTVEQSVGDEWKGTGGTRHGIPQFCVMYTTTLL